MNEQNKDFLTTFCDLLFSLSPNEFSLLAMIIGYILAQPITVAQQNSLGNFFELIGQVILTINAQGSLPDSQTPSNQELLNKMHVLEIEVMNLKRKLRK